MSAAITKLRRWEGDVRARALKDGADGADGVFTVTSSAPAGLVQRVQQGLRHRGALGGLSDLMRTKVWERSE